MVIDTAQQGGRETVVLTPDIAMLLVGAAVRAPSLYNSQPWRFRQLADGGLEVHADHHRALPATDPHGRELVISCGAALATLVLGVRWLGARPEIHRFPDPAQPALLARVAPALACEPSPVELDMFDAVLHRQTHRGPFADVPVDPELLGRLRRAARRSGCRVHLLPAHRLPELSRMTFAAQRVQRRLPAVQREVAEWLRPAWGGHRDGVVVPPAVAGDLGSRWSPRVRPAAPRSAAGPRAAATIVLTTPGDDRASWLRAGEALQHMLLLATCHGAQASFHTEVLEVPATRDALATLVGGDHPQMVLRLGYAEDGSPAPRRSPATVLTMP
ncbi:nitroreductase family protein [Actinoplanes sp. NPDC049802]|uniref:Acg family FMN-binding oxidoreductase n=1 Tax=Actinoplanes sp. NPDC049802 TaxID=3154742 RepID=UPI0033E3A497